MRILPRPKRQRRAAGQSGGVEHAPARLACRVQRADGRTFTGSLTPWQHRWLHLRMLHARSTGFIELTPGTRAHDGRLDIDRRRRPEHYLPARNGARSDGWLDGLLRHAEAIVRGAFATRELSGPPREEAFVGVAARTVRRGTKDAVAESRFLWVDLDELGRLSALWDLLAERPCHLLIESAGSGGMHAYWQLAHPLAASVEDAETGETTDTVERANLRLVHGLGVDERGRPNVADPQCAGRARIMRLAGTVNHKTGQHARIVEANFALAPYALEDLVGDLPDPVPPPASGPVLGARWRLDRQDPYRLIPPPVYFKRLAGIDVPARGGLVSCPVPAHEDVHPSCSVSADPARGWCCHASSCGASGQIYDLASVVLGGPCGKGRLRDEDFKRAEALVVEAFGDRRNPRGDTQ